MSSFLGSLKTKAPWIVIGLSALSLQLEQRLAVFGPPGHMPPTPRLANP